MKNYHLIFIINFIANNIHAQAVMTLLDKTTIPATTEWTFVCENYAYNGFLGVQLGKNGAATVLKLDIKTSTENLFIGDRIFILLKNGDLIYCVDKGKRKYENNRSTIFYNIDAIETKKLLQQNITDIRFKIIGKPKTFDSQIGFFTASNKPTVYDTYSENIINIDTKSAMKSLFKNNDKK